MQNAIIGFEYVRYTRGESNQQPVPRTTGYRTENGERSKNIIRSEILYLFDISNSQQLWDLSSASLKSELNNTIVVYEEIRIAYRKRKYNTLRVLSLTKDKTVQLLDHLCQL